MAFGYRCGCEDDGSGAGGSAAVAGGAGGSGSGQDQAGIYDPGVLQNSEAMAASAYYAGQLRAQAARPMTNATSLALAAALVAGAAWLL